MHWFIAHLLAHLPRLWEVYNAALAEYRRQHKTAIGGASGARSGRRRRVRWKRHSGFGRPTIRDAADCLCASAATNWCLSTRAGIEASLSITPEGDAQTAVAQLLALAERGIRIRTRALITTLAARLLLGDLFLHGIGGAKYDQVTDRLIADFFGLEPPGYMVVSGTLHLPVSHQPARSDDLLQLRHRIRELEFHPERFVEQIERTSAAAGDAGRLDR